MPLHFPSTPPFRCQMVSRRPHIPSSPPPFLPFLNPENQACAYPSTLCLLFFDVGHAHPLCITHGASPHLLYKCPVTGAAPVGVELNGPDLEDVEAKDGPELADAEPEDGPELEDAEEEDGPELEDAKQSDGPELEDAKLDLGASRRGRFARGSRSVTAISGSCPAAAISAGRLARAKLSGLARAEPSGLARAKLSAVLALWAMTQLSICSAPQGQLRRTQGYSASFVTKQ